MLRKLLLLIASLLLMIQTSQAQPLIQPKETEKIQQSNNLKFINFKEIPNLKTGIFFAADDSKFNVLATTDIAQWKFLALEGGYSGDAENTGHKAALTLSIDLLHLGDWIKFPVLDKIVFRPGITVAYGNINFKEMGEGEFTFGPSITAVEFKF